jgi:hypothetical protein
MPTTLLAIGAQSKKQRRRRALRERKKQPSAAGSTPIGRWSAQGADSPPRSGESLPPRRSHTRLPSHAIPLHRNPLPPTPHPPHRRCHRPLRRLSPADDRYTAAPVRPYSSFGPRSCCRYRPRLRPATKPTTSDSFQNLKNDTHFLLLPSFS